MKVKVSDAEMKGQRADESQRLLHSRGRGTRTSKGRQQPQRVSIETVSTGGKGADVRLNY